jgi:signal transduction histidine kinase/CheY-like chemotaxis protein
MERGTRVDAEEEFTLKRADHSSFPALVNVSPLVEPTALLCVIITDLTQQKRHDAERAARAAAEQVNEVLVAADRRKDEFLAMLGHELRNPLAPLRNGIRVLNLIGSNAPAAQQVREMMTRQLESLARLVDDLLDVSRVSHGKIELKKERTDLKLVVLRAVESCRTIIDGRDQRLELDLPDEPVSVVADTVRLIQVVSNLLNNAAKFTPRGGRIDLTAAADPASGQATVSVRDNGQGIAPEMLARVFELFAQADPSASRTEGGLGIGLTLARRVVEMHGGTLEVASDGLGRGSEFVIRLALAAPDEKTGGGQPQRPPDADCAHLPRRSILVVDDNCDSATSLTVLLRLLGHDVRDANDGLQTLRILENFVPDLLLLDLGLPGMDGFEVANQLRSQARFRDLRIVALSGYGGALDRERSRDAGFDEHLVKPIDFAALQSILSSLPSRS